MGRKKSKTSNLGKIVYLGIALVLIIVIGGLSWNFIIKNQATAKSSLVVESLDIDKTEVKADGIDSSQVVIKIINQKAEPSIDSDIWVGLNIAKEEQRTSEYSYFGWYSFEPNRSFYKTDKNGIVAFEVKSKMAGNITYNIYTADPEASGSGKYLDLGKNFTINFVE